jgi:hypothetical protein
MGITSCENATTNRARRELNATPGGDQRHELSARLKDAAKSISTTERYSHLGANGLQPYYVELAACVIDGFVTRVVTSKRPEGGTDSSELIENIWWRRADSNCGPRDYETLALTN